MSMWTYLLWHNGLTRDLAWTYSHHELHTATVERGSVRDVRGNMLDVRAIAKGGGRREGAMREGLGETKKREALGHGRQGRLERV